MGIFQSLPQVISSKSAANLSVTVNQIFIGSQLIEGHRTSCVELLSQDAILSMLKHLQTRCFACETSVHNHLTTQRQESRSEMMLSLSRLRPIKTSFCIRSPYSASQSRRTEGSAEEIFSNYSSGADAYHIPASRSWSCRPACSKRKDMSGLSENQHSPLVLMTFFGSLFATNQSNLFRSKGARR